VPGIEERRARAATTAVFFLTGALYAAWATRIPAVQERLDLTTGALGLAILGLELGAVAGLPAGGILVDRVGSPGALRLGFTLYPGALFAVGLAPNFAGLTAALAAMAAATSVVDVAMNAQGVELERRYRRPILSSMHAGHSFGLVAGGLAGTAAAAAGLPVAAHLGATAALGLLAGIAAVRRLVREPASDGRAGLVHPGGRLVPLGLIAFCAFMLDGAAYNWSAVHLRSERDAGFGLAALAFTLFSLALAVGRLAGDRLVTRLGRVRVVQGCGLVAAGGSTLAIAAQATGPSLAGWALFGLGLSVIAPTVLGAAPEAGRGPAAVSIAAVTTVGYLGSFTGPPAIGALAGLTGLSAALGLLVVVSGVMSLLARPGLAARRE
jgi:MFS family permease